MQRVTEVSHWQLWMWVRMDHLQILQLPKVHEFAFPELVLEDVESLDLAKSSECSDNSDSAWRLSLGA